MLSEKQWDDLKAFRHELHQHPELSFQEFETSALIKARLEKLGYEIKTPKEMKTGVIADIGPKDAPMVALRADIDALPILEKTGLAYASEIDGVMHACGHDLHATSLLAAAEGIAQGKDALTVRVRLIFQPAEEVHLGAEQVLNAGVLDDVQYIVGYHNMPELEAGSLVIEAGARNAAVDQFKVTLHGNGGHAAHPNQNTDVILGMAQMVTGLQSIVSRNIDPLHPAVLSVTHVEGGASWNVMPDELFFEGTLRTFDEKDREQAKKRFYQLVELQAEAMGIDVTIDWIAGPPVLENDGALVQSVRETLASKMTVVKRPASAGGEDFAYYTKQVPAIFAEIGSGSPSGLHHSDLTVDDEALKTAAAWYTETLNVLSKKLANGQ
ncbi:amidohydrolase [Fructobacillus sp. W13]|uniref:Amidohydrolase n=1 Tax=Fructobacillus apis TaxID=2935017 RepID=A0ABT0ZQS9_9LACO|nr:amidohydrolase [Fructobacillus apis]MCO0832347.1 amidohydrolase [Fructobacillus apis]